MKNDTTTFISCLKCSQVPIVSIENVKTVTIICKCEKKTMSLSNYLSELYQSNKMVTSNNHYCERVLSHMNNPSNCYCVDCKEYLCNECIAQHKKYNHSLSPYYLDINIRTKTLKGAFWYCLDCHESFCYDNIKELHSTHYCIRIFSIEM